MNTSRLLFLPLLLVSVFFLSCSEDATNEPATVRISGLVQKAGNAEALPGADVIVSRHDNSEVVGRTLTDSSGVFLVEGLPATIMDIRVEAAGYAPVLFESMDPASSSVALQNMTVEMVAVDSCCSGVLILTVKNGSGEKLKNVPVLIRRAGVIIGDPRTNENGRIVVDGLCPGDYSIRIAADNYKVYEAVFTINTSCEPVEMTAELQMENEVCCDGVLTVTVKNPQGGGILGAQVRVWKGGAVLHKSFTDTTGVVVFTDLCKGEYGVDVIKTGWTDREFTFAINGECDPVSKVVVMEQLACCDGVFTLFVRDKNNNPLANAIVLVRKGSKAVADPRTDANGRIELDQLCAGEYNYRVSLDGYKVVEGTFVINSNCDPVTREINLEQAPVACCDGVFTLTALDPQNQPIAGATVRLWKNGVVVAQLQTNANGVAVFDSLCKGEYGVDVNKDGWTEREVGVLINENCDPVAKTVVMEQLPCCDGVLTLVVRDASNNPVQNAKVQVRKGSKTIEDPVTDANGRIVVDGLCAGEYNYRISREGFKVVEATFVINANCDPVTREVALETETVCCSGVLTVTAVDSASAPVSDATVKLWKNGVVIATHQTDSAGKAVFDGLCKGEYGVDVTKTGFKGREFTFAINGECDPYNKTVELVP